MEAGRFARSGTLLHPSCTMSGMRREFARWLRRTADRVDGGLVGPTLTLDIGEDTPEDAIVFDSSSGDTAVIRTANGAVLATITQMRL
jgi:hypothetical protein